VCITQQEVRDTGTAPLRAVQLSIGDKEQLAGVQVQARHAPLLTVVPHPQLERLETSRITDVGRRLVRGELT